MKFHDLSVKMIKNKKEIKSIKKKLKYLNFLEDKILEDEDDKHFKYFF